MLAHSVLLLADACSFMLWDHYLLITVTRKVWNWRWMRSWENFFSLSASLLKLLFSMLVKRKKTLWCFCCGMWNNIIFQLYSDTFFLRRKGLIRLPKGVGRWNNVIEWLFWLRCVICLFLLDHLVFKWALMHRFVCRVSGKGILICWPN